MADNNQQFDDLRKQAERLNRQLENLGGNAAKNLDDFIKSFGGGIEGATQAVKNLKDQIRGLDTDINYFAESLKKVTNELGKQSNFNKSIEKNYKSLTSLANELYYDQDLLNRLDEQSLKSITKKLEKEKTSLINNVKLNQQRKDEIITQLKSGNIDLLTRQKLRRELTEINKIQSEANGFINDQENGLDKLIAASQKRLQYEKEINSKLGISGLLVDGIINSISRLGISSKFFENVKEDMRDAAETAGSNKWSIFKTGLASISKGLKDALKDPVSQLLLAKQVFEFFIKAAITANKESVNLSKQLGYGAENADRVRANFASIEANAGNLTSNLTATNVTTANLSESFNQLSEATGFVSEYSADALITQIKLTKQLGLTGDEAAGVYKFSVLTGQSSEATYKSMLRGYVATRNSLNVGIPFKAAMAEAAKVSGQLASNLGNNPEAIIKGVVATKALGTSLEQAKQQGEKLLDFQSSIESELKAELITGQQLNLERARAAALMGDQVTVAEELAAQGMTAEKFSKMNVIAQQSYAEALGTTADELANQLSKREQAIASGKSLAQITAEEAEEAAERQDIQEKFNNAMLKLQSIIGNLLAGPLGSFLEMLSGALGIINHFATPLKFVLGAYLAINAAKKIGLGYDIAMNAAARINQSLGQSIAATNIVKNQLEKQSLLTRIAGNVQLFYQLASEHGIAKALAIQFGWQQVNTNLKKEGLLLTMREWFYEKGKTIWSAITKSALVTINALKTIGLAISKRETLTLIGQAIISGFKGAIEFYSKLLGPLAIPVALVTAGAVGSLAYSMMKDGVVDPNKGPVMTGDFGSVQLDKNDKAMYGADGKIKVGTNLLGEGKIETNRIETIKSTPSIDITPMISAINQVTAAVTTLNNKSWDVKLDSKSVGLGLMQNSHRSA